MTKLLGDIAHFISILELLFRLDFISVLEFFKAIQLFSWAAHGIFEAHGPHLSPDVEKRTLKSFEPTFHALKNYDASHGNMSKVKPKNNQTDRPNQPN